MTSNIVITMAGGGRRFRDAGYAMPKFQVEVLGRTLFDWSMSSLRDYAETGWNFVFIAQATEQVGPFLTASCPRLGIREWRLVELPALTDGQATTALQARSAVASERAPLMIYNIDTYVEPWSIPPAAIRGDGWIPCFPGLGDAWSFARTEADTDRVIEVREKTRISPHCTVGLYYFSGFNTYADTYDRYYSAGKNLEKGERYIAPLYNQLIADGKSVYIHRLPQSAVHPLGTPAETQAFIRGMSDPRPLNQMPSSGI